MAEVKLKIKNLKFKIERKELLTLVSILALGAFLRLYRISEYMTFLGDEGRDAIVVRRLLLYADPILVGPGTSIGNMYLGPLYYYFMAPWLFLSNYSPVGPAIGIAILGVITIWFVWFIATRWFGKLAGFVAAFLYAIAPTVIIYSRSSWNPNIMPFFALLCIWSIWKVWEEKKYKWMIVLGVSFAFVLQSHYLGLLLAPVFAIFWFLTFLDSKKRGHTKYLIQNTIYSAALFALLMSPLVIFDARHGWRNFDSLKKFFTERQTTVSIKPWNAIPGALPLFEQINGSLLAAKDVFVAKLASVVLLLPLLSLKGKYKKPFFLLFVWFGFAVLGMGLYKQHIYDHYFGFIFPVPFLILAGLIKVLSDKRFGKIAAIALVVVLVVTNLLANPLRNYPNRQMQRAQEVAAKIIEESKGEEFNLAVIAEQNYDDGYEYFLRVYDAKMIDIDPQRHDETVTEQLFVVCEKRRKDCDPTHNAKAEVANFGWSKIDQSWEVAGTILFKLGHTQ